MTSSLNPSSLDPSSTSNLSSRWSNNMSFADHSSDAILTPPEPVVRRSYHRTQRIQQAPLPRTHTHNDQCFHPPYTINDTIKMSSGSVDELPIPSYVYLGCQGHRLFSTNEFDHWSIFGIVDKNGNVQETFQIRTTPGYMGQCSVKSKSVLSSMMQKLWYMVCLVRRWF